MLRSDLEDSEGVDHVGDLAWAEGKGVLGDSSFEGGEDRLEG